MKKFGFTLAEVLITLGIVGVVAALTAPGLVMSSRNEANAAKLSVVVSNLENAFTSAIVSEGANDLYGTRMWTNAPVNAASGLAARRAFAGELGRYLNITGTSSTANNPTMAYYGGDNVHSMNSTGQTSMETRIRVFPVNPNNMVETFPIFLKNGAVIHIVTYARENPVPNEDNIRALGGSLIWRAGGVVIDVNGPAAPNTYGRDIFFFNISEKGVLYPYGGMDSAIKMNNNNNDWRVAGSNYNCTQGDFGVGGWKGIGCTARIIEEGYKMNY